MENTRPSNTIQLPVKVSEELGKIVTCTVKTPKIISVRQFREDTRKMNFSGNAYTSIYEQAEKVSAAIEILQKNGTPQTEIDKGIADLESLVEKMTKADTDSYERMCRRIFNVINVPNADDGTQRGYEDVDWDNANLEEVQRGITFFRVSYGDLPKEALN